MNLDKNPGKVLHGIMVAAAALFALPAALVFLLGFFYAGLAGDSPGSTGYLRYSMFASAGLIATLLVVIGFFGSASNKKIFPVFIIVGTSLLLIILIPIVLTAFPKFLQVWMLLVVLVDFSALVLSGLRLKQMSSMR